MRLSECNTGKSWARRAVVPVFLAVALMSPLSIANVTVWDISTPLGDNPDLANRAQWKAVPTDPMTLEAHPEISRSDPGYYGREYEFASDTAVTNDHYTVTVSPGSSSVMVFSGPEHTTQRVALAPQVSPDTKITGVRLVRNSPVEAVIEVIFGNSSQTVSTLLCIDATRIITIKPDRNTPPFELQSGIAYGIAPDFIADDLILTPQAGHDRLEVLADNVFVGLLTGCDAMLVMTWPTGSQRIALNTTNETFDKVSFDHNGKTFSIALLETPNIWHKEVFKPTHLEKDVPSDWKRPFRAKWITQLNEAEVQTRYTFRESSGTIWRGAFGSYNYPVWFDGDTAVYRMSKKIPPKGESIVYFLEGSTDPSITTPVDIIKTTFGRELSETILDPAGRMLRTHHRRGAIGVRRACTCGGTEAIEAIFKSDREIEQAEEVRGIVDDMGFFVTSHVERIEQYMQMASNTITWLDQIRGNEAFVKEMKSVLSEMLQEQEKRKELVKSLDFMADLTRRTKALTLKDQKDNLTNILKLCKEWRSMGGAQDDLLAQCHRLTRRLFQQAGIACTTNPETLGIAREIRRRCKQVLRHPDGYEVWADY